MELLIAGALIVSWLAVGFEGWLLFLLVKQHGQALMGQEEMRGRLAAAEAAIQTLARPQVPSPDTGIPSVPEGLPIGSPAPDFALPNLKGRQRGLKDYLGEPVTAVFFDPTCGFCHQLAPRLGRLPAGAGTVVVLSRGDVKENQKIARENGWKCDVLIESGWDVAGAYGTNATPTGYLIDRDGRIASRLKVGVEPVLELTGPSTSQKLTMDTLLEKERAAEERARAAGLMVTESALERHGLAPGTPAPDFTLPDLDGRDHTLAELRGKRVLLVFSDPGCGPCQELAPQLEQLHRSHRDNNLQVLMVSREPGEGPGAGAHVSHPAAAAVGDLALVCDVRHTHRIPHRRPWRDRQRSRGWTRADPRACPDQH